MKLKTASDWVNPRGFFVALDERYKIPYKINYYHRTKQVIEKINIFEN